MDQFNKQIDKLVSFGHIVQVYEGISMCSPKTVKSAADIIDLWMHEIRLVLWNERYKTEKLQL